MHIFQNHTSLGALQTFYLDVRKYVIYTGSNNFMKCYLSIYFWYWVQTSTHKATVMVEKDLFKLLCLLRRKQNKFFI